MKSILIAEDEYDIAIALELVLSEEGYRVVLASNGEEALIKLREERVQLVLLDNMMPRMTGLETLLVLKSNPEFAQIPVILMSAITPRGSQKEYGWAAFMRKPFDVYEVLRLVEKLIDGVKS